MITKINLQELLEVLKKIPGTHLHMEEDTRTNTIKIYPAEAPEEEINLNKLIA